MTTDEVIDVLRGSLGRLDRALVAFQKREAGTMLDNAAEVIAEGAYVVATIPVAVQHVRHEFALSGKGEEVARAAREALARAQAARRGS